jgi:hypothetical protein
MSRDKNIIDISPKLQLEIFEMVFLHLIEYASTRWKMKAIIDSRDNVDNAEVDLKLRRLELELLKKEDV